MIDVTVMMYDSRHRAQYTQLLQVNSAIMSHSNGDVIKRGEVVDGKFRVSGWAFSGAGNDIIRVEVLHCTTF